MWLNLRQFEIKKKTRQEDFKEIETRWQQLTFKTGIRENKKNVLHNYIILDL